VQAALAEGQSWAEIIAANGGDLEAVKTAVLEAAEGASFLQDQDPEAFVTGFLEGGFNGRSGTE
jgi:hypothetical protein